MSKYSDWPGAHSTSQAEFKLAVFPSQPHCLGPQTCCFQAEWEPFRYVEEACLCIFSLSGRVRKAKDRIWEGGCQPFDLSNNHISVHLVPVCLEEGKMEKEGVWTLITNLMLLSTILFSILYNLYSWHVVSACFAVWKQGPPRPPPFNAGERLTVI